MSFYDATVERYESGEFAEEKRQQATCEHEWETIDEGGGGSEFQPPDPVVEQCCLCGRRREGR